MPKLTKKFVDDLVPAPKDYFEWDVDPSRFGVRVWPSGKKTYLVQYRVGRETKRVKIANHGTLTVEEARKQARVLLGEVAKGVDPATERANRRKAMTVADLCSTYLGAAEKGLVLGKRGLPKKASTIATDRGRISRHIVPLLGRKLVVDLVPPDVHKFVRDVTSGKTAAVVKTGLRGKAIVEGGPGTARRTTGLLGGILTFAVSEGIIATNPATGVRRPAGKVRTRRLSDEEIRILGQAMWNARGSGAIPDRVMSALLLVAITGCRFGEIEKLKWSEVDEAGGCLRLADTKTGPSVRPVAPAVFGTLRSAVAERDGVFVFPGKRSGKHYCGLRAAWNRVARDCGFTDVTPHTLRHTFASIGDDLGLTTPTISALLGHSSGSQTSKYIHKVDEALIAAAKKVVDYLSDMLFYKQRPIQNWGKPWGLGVAVME